MTRAEQFLKITKTNRITSRYGVAPSYADDRKLINIVRLLADEDNTEIDKDFLHKVSLLESSRLHQRQTKQLLEYLLEDEI
jgi:hypothetical protein